METIHSGPTNSLSELKSLILSGQGQNIQELKENQTCRKIAVALAAWSISHPRPDLGQTKRDNIVEQLPDDESIDTQDFATCLRAVIFFQKHLTNHASKDSRPPEVNSTRFKDNLESLLSDPLVDRKLEMLMTNLAAVLLEAYPQTVNRYSNIIKQAKFYYKQSKASDSATCLGRIKMTILDFSSSLLEKAAQSQSDLTAKDLGYLPTINTLQISHN